MKIGYKEIVNSFTKDELEETKILAHTAINGRENCLQKVVEKIGLKGTNIVEIGTYRGISAAMFTSYFDKVYTFDIIEYPIRKLVFERMKVENKVESYVLKSRAEIRGKLLELKRTINFDSAFIDGAHNFWDAGKDFLICAEIGIKKFLFHDCSEKHEGMLRLMKIFDAEIINDICGYLVLR